MVFQYIYAYIVPPPPPKKNTLVKGGGIIKQKLEASLRSSGHLGSRLWWSTQGLNPVEGSCACLGAERVGDAGPRP